MTTAYSTNLELALPVQGELSGTWGDTVNNGITQYLDAAIAGSQIISGSQTAVTLANTNGDASATNIAQAGSGATGTAQYQIIRCTGNPASLLTITIDDTLTAGYSKTFIIINATSTSQSVKIVGSGPTTGITVASGDKALVAWNGSDFVRVGASAGGSDTQVQFNSGGNLAGSANMTFDGTTLTAAAFSGPLTGAVNGTVGATTPTTVVATQVNVTAQGDVRFEDTTGGQYVALQAPGTVSTNVTFTLPGTDGSTGQLLSTNGSGVLSFTTVSSPAYASGALIVNTTTVSENYTVPAGSNAFSVGPITISSGFAITVSSGQRWVVL
jgi:hypothetical protein